MPDSSIPATRRGASTRARITTTASQLLRRQGYAATGLNQVLTESGAPKGSLYHYFPAGKEQLASEALARSTRKVSETIEAAFSADRDLPAVLDAFAGLLASNLERSGFRDGCPVGTVALEAAAQSEAIGEACARSFATWQAELERHLAGRGTGPDGAREAATLILCAFEGALMMARALKDTDPLFSVAGSIRHRLEQLTQGAST